MRAGPAVYQSGMIRGRRRPWPPTPGAVSSATRRRPPRPPAWPRKSWRRPAPRKERRCLDPRRWRTRWRCWRARAPSTRAASPTTGPWRRRRSSSSIGRTPSSRGSRGTAGGCTSIRRARGRSIRSAWREALGDEQPRRRLDRVLPPAGRGAALAGGPRRMGAAPVAGRHRRGVSRRHPHRRTRRAASARAETPARRRELAEGLGYWAATYEVLPESSHAAPAGALPSASIARVEALPADRQSLHRQHHRSPRAARPLPSVCRRGGPDRRLRRASALLSNMTETFAAVFLANVPPGSWITYVHAVTGPSAIRLLLPHLDARSQVRAPALRLAGRGGAVRGERRTAARAGGAVAEAGRPRRRSWTARSRPATSTRSSSPRRACASTR